MTKSWTRDEINVLLRSNDLAVERAIVRLFELQTQDEQSTAATHLDNKCGFSACDAKAGTRFARWLLGMDDNNVKRFEPKSLSHPLAARIFYRYCKDGETPMERARRIALRHSQQITDLANGDLAVAA